MAITEGMEALVFEKLGNWNVVGGLELSLLVELVGKQRAPVHELFGRQEGVPDIAGMEQVIHKHLIMRLYLLF